MLWDASSGGFEEQPLQGMNGRYDDEDSTVLVEGGIGQEAPNAAPSMQMHSWFAVVFASVVWGEFHIHRTSSHPHIWGYVVFFLSGPYHP